MSSPLEKFIQTHRDEFDSEIPAPELWQKLKKKLDHPVKENLFTRSWLIAATVVAVAGLLTFLLTQKPNSTKNSIAVQTTSGTNDLMNDINPTYAKEVYHFTQLIELKQSELKNLQQTDPSLYRQFLGDITRLDSSYNALKQELPENPNREQLLEAMIQNLRLQTDLLNEQLLIIKKIKQSKISNNETNSKSI
ncbi:MAG TPA: hypothetical protein VM012_08460 [Flavitalea sp.]|nr:hypothetical protein [Flavitalea sp.]